MNNKSIWSNVLGFPVYTCSDVILGKNVVSFRCGNCKQFSNNNYPNVLGGDWTNIVHCKNCGVAVRVSM